MEEYDVCTEVLRQLKPAMADLAERFSYLLLRTMHEHNVPIDDNADSGRAQSKQASMILSYVNEVAANTFAISLNLHVSVCEEETE